MGYRHAHHVNIQKKLAQIGMCVEVRLVADGLEEKAAFSIEKERIAFWRECGVRLANKTDGGEGTCGLVHSPASRKALGERKRGNKNRLGAVLSDETKEKIAAGHRGKKFSEQHLKSMSVAAMGEKNGFFGKTHSVETRKKVAEANRRRVWSEESKQKLSINLKGRTGGKRSVKWKLGEETKRKMSEAQKLRWAKKKLSDAACTS